MKGRGLEKVPGMCSAEAMPMGFTFAAALPEKKPDILLGPYPQIIRPYLKGPGAYSVFLQSWEEGGSQFFSVSCISVCSSSHFSSCVFFSLGFERRLAKVLSGRS